MFKKSPKGYYSLEEFDKQKGLVHGFSGRELGGCSPSKKKNALNIEKFLAALGLERGNLVAMEQVHGDRIKAVGKKDGGKIILGVDGLITREKGLALGVKTADCLPILYYDSVGKIISVVHAGWRGVLEKLPQKMIDLMIRLGSLPGNVMVGIGPGIGGCCYNIDLERTKRFEKEFGLIGGMIRRQKDKFYLDLLMPTVIQLIHSGVPEKNIELAAVCTSCRDQDFFSYRKDSKETFREMLGVIERQ